MRTACQMRRPNGIASNPNLLSLLDPLEAYGAKLAWNESVCSGKFSLGNFHRYATLKRSFTQVPLPLPTDSRARNLSRTPAKAPLFSFSLRYASFGTHLPWNRR